MRVVPDLCYGSYLGESVKEALIRFRWLGKLEDLEEAIACHRRALAACPLGQPHHPSSLKSLSRAMFILFVRLGRMEDLEEVVTYYHGALTLRPVGHTI
jgi:hypothetical protein